MSDVQQRVEPHRSEDASLESHHLATPTTVVAAALDQESGHGADSEIERVIEEERSKVVIKLEPRQEISKPIVLEPTEEKIVVKNESPSIHAQVIVERTPEKPIEPPVERTLERPIERKVEPEFFIEAKTEQPIDLSIEPPVKHEREKEEDREEVIEVQPTPVSPQEPEVIVEKKERKPQVQDEIVIEVAAPIEPEVYTPAKSLEERIEQIRLELNVPQTVIPEPDVHPAAYVKDEIDEEQIIDEPQTVEPIVEVKPQIIPQTQPPQIQKARGPELKMAERETMTLEQAMKFDLTRAKIGTGQKVPKLRFRGHGVGTGTPLDRLITAIADFIKRWEMRFLSFLTRRRLEKRSKPAKVVSAEDDSLQFESFSSSLAQERKRRRRAFFRLSK